ncbi:MAG TPA: GNAT family N-acetyltransferase [Anaerolineae bacterium]|nr:GNAT family N-acetyltransferase [Anaerolineae bacterium]
MRRMFSLFNRSSLTADALQVRPARMADRAAIYDLTEHHHRVHFNLDWWSFDNWLYSDRPSDAIWLAFDQGQLVGLLLAPYDDAPIAWLRSIAIANGYPAEPVMTALLRHARPSLRALDVQAVTVLAHPEWVANLLPRVKFAPSTAIVTFRKSDRALPAPSQSGEAIIRAANMADVPAITLNDRAAFEPLWWHSAASIDHILRSVSHFVVAQIDDRIVGHAFSDVYGGQGHLIRLVVKPEFQGRGLGEQLLIESLTYQLNADAYPFTLNTQADNLSSQALYRRYGYRLVGRPVQVMKSVTSDE